MDIGNKQRTILLIDDDPLIVRMYERKLTQEGFAVMLARNGEAALRALETETPDLILLDVLMPAMNGWETLKRIRKDGKLKDVPVFMLTSLGDRQEDIDTFKEAGANEYLVKSQIELSELVNVIRKYLPA